MQSIRAQLDKEYHLLNLEDFFLGNSRAMMTNFNNAISSDKKIILYHSENIDFYSQWINTSEMRDLQQLINQKSKNVCVLAHGVNENFPFKYINHFDFWIDIKNRNNGIQLSNAVKHKDKDFLFLTRRATEHRRQLREKLQMKGCLENSLYSYIDGGDKRHLPREYEHEKFNDPIFKSQQCYYEPAIWNLLPQQYNATKYSIVPETVETNYVHCLSEKIFKPIIGGHLFVVFAGAGYLSYLRSIGFKTFGDYIDEGYDDELDAKCRIDKIVQVCNSLRQEDYNTLHQKIQGILQHNYELFFNDGHLQLLNTHIMERVKSHFEN